MQKDLLSKLLNARLQVKTEQLNSQNSQLYNGKYKTSIVLHKEYGSNCFWTISVFGASEEITSSINTAYDAFLKEIKRLCSDIDTLYQVECNYAIQNDVISTHLNIWLEERILGGLKTFISHKKNSVESAELLLIQAKKFIVDELTKIKESIS